MTASSDPPDNNGGVASDLDRFVRAQEGVYSGVVDELRRGRKVGHWIWFIFPQFAGLGRSPVAEHYALRSIEEARAYLDDPILGPRLIECAGLLLGAPPTRSAAEILGELDAMKLRSSMTLFHRAEPAAPVFRQVLDRFFSGQPDPATDRLLASTDAM
jgi:uncharacterized protein (DUF1810 family)